MNAVAAVSMDKMYRTKSNPTPVDEDTLLLERCHNQEASAFEELYCRYRTLVYRIVSRMITLPDDQEEIVQEVFFQIFKSLPSFRGKAKLSTWVHRITLNVILQHFRRKRCRVQLQLESDVRNYEFSNLVQNDLETPEEFAMRKERQKTVAQALRTLSEKKQVALVLHDFKGLSATEISLIVGAPVFTVRTRVFYARRAFYRYLASASVFADIPIKQEKTAL